MAGEVGSKVKGREWGAAGDGDGERKAERRMDDVGLSVMRRSDAACVQGENGALEACGMMSAREDGSRWTESSRESGMETQGTCRGLERRGETVPRVVICSPFRLSAGNTRRLHSAV